MPTTLTLKNVPDELYERLKWLAERHRRSINSEVIVSLESLLLPHRVTAAERLARAKVLRAPLEGRFKAKQIDDFKKAGRA